MSYFGHSDIDRIDLSSNEEIRKACNFKIVHSDNVYFKRRFAQTKGSCTWTEIDVLKKLRGNKFFDTIVGYYCTPLPNTQSDHFQPNGLSCRDLAENCYVFEDTCDADFQSEKTKRRNIRSSCSPTSKDGPDKCSTPLVKDNTLPYNGGSFGISDSRPCCIDCGETLGSCDRVHSQPVHIFTLDNKSLYLDRVVTVHLTENRFHSTLMDISKRLDMDSMVKLLQQLLAAVDFLNSCGFIHTNISPRSVLVDERSIADNSFWGSSVKLVDLDNVVPLGSFPSTYKKASYIDERFAAPEIYVFDKYVPKKNVDVYSVAACALWSVDENCPFPDMCSRMTLMDRRYAMLSNICWPEDGVWSVPQEYQRIFPEQKMNMSTFPRWNSVCRKARQSGWDNLSVFVPL